MKRHFLASVKNKLQEKHSVFAKLIILAEI